MTSLKDRFLSKVSVNPDTGCWDWVGSIHGDSGYGQISVRCKTKRAHRVAFELYKGAIAPKAVILHTCDNRKCVNPDHLQQGTQSENMIDAVRKGRLKPPAPRVGKDHHAAVWSDEDVIKFRQEYVEGRKLRSIVEETGRSESTVKRMLWGQTYGHLPVRRITDPKRGLRKVGVSDYEGILLRYREGESMTSIAKSFGCTSTVIKRALTKKAAELKVTFETLRSTY